MLKETLKSIFIGEKKYDFYTPNGIYNIQIPFTKYGAIANAVDGKVKVYHCRVEIKVGEKYTKDSEESILITLFEDDQNLPVNNFVGEIMSMVVGGFLNQISTGEYPCELIKSCRQQYDMENKRYLYEWRLEWDVQKKCCFASDETLISINELSETEK
ncbi:hypothetical protein ACQKFK_31130 [Bacillus mycoides]|uniref:Uncharacterized protein n=1 Tax=Bacillus thuringiensis subsp. higo TaxID=132266 RepID=A0A9X6QP46_BACUH|nr:MULTISPECIES: hypothetical protein [Bacillus cereus group]OUB47991.1 hypothetical protein BK716_19865 [Bacillus thuringiensis serovar higo]QWI46862.1 hypothetical protein EXW55_28730 [Bacillus mycoides]